MNPQGKKEIREAVIIAGLSALATGLANFAIDKFKEWYDEGKKKRKKKR